MIKDRFGITQLYNDAPGIQWYNNWDNGVKRTINGKGTSTRNPDPKDPMVDFHCLSYSNEGNQMIVYGNGEVKIKGNHPRLYINDLKRKFKNVEMTVYGKFIDFKNQTGSYTTYRLATRSNHHNTHKCPCDGKGYATEINIRQDNFLIKDSRFRKELVHPHYANSYYAIPKLDMRKWLGFKFVLYTDANNNVVNQTYIDTTEGKNGGNWQKIGEFVDTGSNWSINTPKELENIEKDISSCSGCLDSKAVKPYNEKITRAGFSSYLRTDFVDDARFKWFSVREIGI